MILKRKVCIAISEQDHDRLQALANESLRTCSGYIRHLIKVYLRHLEQHPEDKLK